MKFTANQVAKLMIDSYAGAVKLPATVQANFSAEETMPTINEVISDAFFQILEVDPETATVKDVNLAFRNESVRNAVFAIVEEVIREGIINETWRNEFFDRFVESKSEARGDKTVFYIESRNEVTYSRVSKDGKVAIDRQRFDEGDELEVKKATYAVKVYEHLARILLSRSEWGKFVGKLNEATEQFIAEKIYATFASVCNNLPTQFRHAGAYNRKLISEKIANVKRTSGAKSVILVGTDIALQYLEDGVFDDASKVSNTMRDELFYTGRMGTWFGNTLVELPNAWKQGSGMTKPAMQDNVIFIIPDNVNKPVKLIVEPELLNVNESGVRVDDTIEFANRITFGCAVVTGNVLGVISMPDVTVEA